MITGAGWANHLTGMCDAYLRYARGVSRPLVIGVAFEDPNNTKHTMAAMLSISEVPKTQVVFGDQESQFYSSDGFLRACKFACFGKLPEITIPNTVPPKTFTLKTALAEIV